MTNVNYPYNVLPIGWKPYDPNHNYCGPESSSISIFICRRITFVDTNKCCWAHDQRYAIGGKEADREYADKIFYENMKICIKEAYKWYNPLYLRAMLQARVRYYAVSEYGEKFFTYK